MKILIQLEDIKIIFKCPHCCKEVEHTLKWYMENGAPYCDGCPSTYSPNLPPIMIEVEIGNL